MMTERGARRPFLIQKKGDSGMCTLKINTLLDSDKVFDSWENCWYREDLYAVDVLDEHLGKIMTISMYVKVSPVKYDGFIWTLSDWKTEQPQDLKAFKKRSAEWVMMNVVERSDKLTWIYDHRGIDYDLDFNFEIILRDL